MNSVDFIGDKVTYDKEGTYFWAHKGDSMQMLCDLRGWGAIQNLFKNEDGSINFPEAEKYQDAVGAWIADAINEKLHRDSLRKSIEDNWVKE